MLLLLKIDGRRLASCLPSDAAAVCVVTGAAFAYSASVATVLVVLWFQLFLFSDCLIQVTRTLLQLIFP